MSMNSIWNMDLPNNAPGRVVCPKCGARYKVKYAVKNDKGETVCPGCSGTLKRVENKNAKQNH